MLRLTLSDYAGDKLKEAYLERQADYETRYALYNQALTDREAKANQLKERSLNLLTRGRILSYLFSIFPE